MEVRLNTVRHVTSICPSITPVSTAGKFGATVFRQSDCSLLRLLSIPKYVQLNDREAYVTFFHLGENDVQ